MSETKIKTDEVFGAAEMMSGAEFTGPRETYIELNSGERATQFRFSSEKLNNEQSGGLINNISNSTSVKAFLSNTGHIEVKLVGPNSEVGREGERSLWKNGEFQDGYKSYISVGDETEFENELKKLTLDEIKNRKYSNINGDVYPGFLNINDGTDMIDQEAIDKAKKLALGEQKASATGGGEGGGGGGSNGSGGEGTDSAKLEFGKVDSIIQKLSLRNLIYPIDADFGNTQDYMKIEQFTYRAPNQSLFFGTNEEKEEKKLGAGDILRGGLPLGTPREKRLGQVKLPMPNSLADSNNVSWGADQLNALTAAVASGVMGQVNPFLNQTFDTLSGDKGNLEKAGAVITDTVERIRTAFKEAGVEFGKGAKAFGTTGTPLNMLGTSVIGSAILNILQVGLTPEAILARGQGVVPNNNLALLFNSPTLREFTFTWKLTPRSREEATRVNNIIRFFKQGMAPKKGINTATGAGSYFLGTPNVFDLSFRTSKEGGFFFFDGDDRNHSVVRIKTCACTGAAVNYTPDGMWNAYERGQPVSVTLSLRFAELEPIFDTDYDDNLFNYDPARPDLKPVPIDAVGY